MNSCILMAEVVQDPELRFTPDNQTAISEMWVEFPGLRDEDPASRLKVVGWGNLAQEIQERYHVGDKVIIEGRLQMSTIERQEGFKEKRAEMTAQKVYLLGAEGSLTATSVPPAPLTASAPAAKPAYEPAAKPAAKPASKPAAKSEPARSEPAGSEPAKTPAYAAPEAVDYDEIPF